MNDIVLTSLVIISKPLLYAKIMSWRNVRKLTTCSSDYFDLCDDGHVDDEQSLKYDMGRKKF